MSRVNASVTPSGEKFQFQTILQKDGGMKRDYKPRPCAVEDCDRYAVSRGYCALHYIQSRKGKRLALRKRLPLAAKPWEWLGDENSLAAMTAAQEKENGK